MNKHLELFTSFFKIGLFTFGGGLAMIPLISKEAVEKRGWITDDEVLDMVAIAESTPGVIAVNSATYIGYKVGGFLGSLVATIGVTLPSFVIICLLSLIIDQFLANTYVAYAFMGIRCVVAVLILNAAIKLVKVAPKTIYSLVIFLLAIALTFIFPSVSSIYFILAGFGLGILWYAVINKPTEAPSVDTPSVENSSTEEPINQEPTEQVEDQPKEDEVQ